MCFSILCTLLAGMLTGCGSGGGSAAKAETNGGAAMDTPTETPASEEEIAADSGWADESSAEPTTSSVLANAKIIQEGSMELQSTNFEDTDAFLRKLTENLEGYLESTTVGGDIGYRYATYVVRVPQDSYNYFFNQVGENCHVIHSASNARNVTEEYVDTEIRLSSLKTKHERLLALLAKADTMEAIVALESELADNEYEIERLSGSLRKYDSLINFSTISLTLDEVPSLAPVTSGNSFGDELIQAFTNGTSGITTFLRTSILILIAVWPFTLIIIIVLVIVLIRRRKAKKPAKLGKSDSEHPENPDFKA